MKRNEATNQKVLELFIELFDAKITSNNKITVSLLFFISKSFSKLIKWGLESVKPVETMYLVQFIDVGIEIEKGLF